MNRYKPNKYKRILAMALTLCLTLTLLPTAAFAADSAKIQAGTGTIINESTIVGFAGQEWWVIGYGGAGVYADSGVTLLAKGGTGQTKFDSSTSSNDYANSELKKAIDAIENDIPKKERAAIAPRTLKVDQYNVNSPYSDGVASTKVDEALLWPLSTREAKGINNDILKLSPKAESDSWAIYTWWLRSPGAGNSFAAHVRGDGSVAVNGSAVSVFTYAARPALNLNLTSVFFTSAATGGKSGAVGSFVGAAAPDGTIKFTMKDSDQKLTLIANEAQAIQNAEILTFSHKDVTTGEKQYISCVLVDTSDEIKYYAKLKDMNISSSSGALSIPLSDVANGTYTLKVFSEQANDDKYTDFASTPVTMMVTVADGKGTVTGFGGEIDKTAPTLTAGDVSRTSDTNATVKFTSDEAGAYFYNIGSDAIDTTDTGTACETTEQTITLTGLSEGAKDIYIVVKDLAGNLSNNTFKIAIPAYVAPTITVTPTTADFNNVTVGTTSSAIVLNVTGTALTGKISDTVDGDTGAFALDKTGYNETTGGKISVTFKPTEARSYSINIKFESAGATPVLINLSGTGVAVVVPTITVNPITADFNNVTVNTTSSAIVLNVTGTGLSGKIGDTVGGDTGAFAIDKTGYNETTGGKISVTFKPTEARSYSANIRFESAGVTPVTINLSGTGIAVVAPPSNTGGGSSYSRTDLDKAVDNTVSDINSAKPGDRVTLDMSKDSVLPDKVLNALAGKEVTLTLNMGGGVKWVIHGTDLTKSSYGNLNLGVNAKANTIPVTVINNVTGQVKVMQLSLTHNGAFGFTMTMLLETGKENAGHWANLYYYNPTTKALEYRNSSVIDANGVSAVPFSGASDYAVVIDKANLGAPKFTDITTHWAKDSIDFVAARGLLTGTTETTFSPNSSMTRGMFVTALGRLSGVDSSKYKNTKFTDVKADAYYVPYVAWASEKGITTGTTDTTFSPDKPITRQEMATLMVNYAKAMNCTLTKTGTAADFEDSGSMASWATEAVKAMQMAGVMNGKNGNTFDPRGTATRAEVSAVLMRFLQPTMSTDTTDKTK